MCKYLASKLQNFFANDAGAITVDWVVLTAAIVALGSGAVFTIIPALVDTGGKISLKIDEAIQ